MNKPILIMLLTVAAMISSGYAGEDHELIEALRRSMIPAEQVEVNDDDLDFDLALIRSNEEQVLPPLEARQIFISNVEEIIALRRSGLNDLHDRFQKAKAIGMTLEERDAFRRERSEILHTYTLPGEDEVLTIIWAMDQEFANTLDTKCFKSKQDFDSAFDKFWETRLDLQLSIAHEDHELRLLLLNDAFIEREKMSEDFAEDIDLIVKAEEAEHKRLAEVESKQIVAERDTYKISVTKALADFRYTIVNDSFTAFESFLKKREISTEVHSDILLSLWEEYITSRSINI